MKRQLMPMTSVILHDPFWLAWQEAFANKGLQHQYEQCVESGRFENFERVARGEASGHTGYCFNDSDVYKWLEAASYCLASRPDWQGRHLVDKAIKCIANAQDGDGYVGTPFQVDYLGKRWKALTAKHEMYCIGHLIEAGVAHRDATEGHELYDVGVRAANLVVETFGPELTPGYCGHQEIELALCRLASCSGDSKYKKLAKWMVESRGHRPSPFEMEFDDPVSKELNAAYVPLVFTDGRYSGAYFQDDTPLADQTEAVGHAVRAMYYYCGAIDACDDPKTLGALSTIWSNLVRKKMYVTGGIGSSGRNEGFTTDFDLPNRDAYSETCAAIGLVFWASRMSRLTGCSKYADVMELALYNAALSGVNFETHEYFYENPLSSGGDHRRKPWFGCACCPPNIARLVMSVQRYGAYKTEDGLTIDMPFSAEYSVGSSRVIVESEYPWTGQIKIRIMGDHIRLKVRVPSWCPEWTARLSGQRFCNLSNGYLDVPPFGGSSGSLEVDLAMPPRWLECDPRVSDNIGRVALAKGPLVYCLEEVDFGSPVHLFMADTSVSPTLMTTNNPRQREALVVLGATTDVANGVDLYSPIGERKTTKSSTKFIPYFSWANRASGSMAVWQRTVNDA